LNPGGCDVTFCCCVCTNDVIAVFSNFSTTFRFLPDLLLATFVTGDVGVAAAGEADRLRGGESLGRVRSVAATASTSCLTMTEGREGERRCSGVDRQLEEGAMSEEDPEDSEDEEESSSSDLEITSGMEAKGNVCLLRLYEAARTLFRGRFLATGSVGWLSLTTVKCCDVIICCCAGDVTDGCCSASAKQATGFSRSML